MRVRLQRERLLDHLARSGISQNHWALRIGLSRGHWSDLVNGKHPYPSPRTRRLMLEALGLPFEELFEVEAARPEGGDGRVHASLPDRYVVDREIGEGAMGTVFAARDLVLGRVVAIKVVSPEAISGIGSEAFTREIHRAAQLQHPNILPVYDAGEAAGHPFFVMPYIEGGSLRGLLEREGRLGTDETVAVLGGIAAALDFAHSRRVLHCDVKPENVLLAGRHPYVADFGLSRAIHSETREWERRPEIDVAAGTPAYVSPEQARGHLDLDGRSDVYSLGCVGFEMLTGRPPFTGTTTTQIMRRRFEALAPDVRDSVPEVPAAVADGLRGAMSLEPDERPASSGALMDSLGESLAGSRQPREGRPGPALAAVTARISKWPSRATGGLRTMAGLGSNLRASFFALLRQPTVTLVALATLALGIGANTAMFSIIHGAVLKPLAYDEPDRLVRVYTSFDGRACCTVSVPNFLDVRDKTRQIENLAASGAGHLTLTGGEEPARVAGGRVSRGFFEVFRVEPRLGRLFAAEDHAAGAPKVAILSEELWRERFAGDEGVLGSVLQIDGEAHVVVGVVPAGLTLAERARLWLPFAWEPGSLPGRGSNFLRVYGRLAPGATLQASEAELESLFAPLVEEYPDSNERNGLVPRPLADAVVSSSQKEPLYVLWGAVALVLLIACANVTNLLLARAEARRKELAVRSALGAGQLQLLGSFLAESVLLSLTGAVVGVATAALMLEALLGLFAGAVPRQNEIGIDATVLFFSALLAVATGLAVGMVVWLRSRSVELSETLKESSRAAVGRHARLRAALVVTQVSLALVLAAGAGLLLKSFWQLSAVDLGLEVEELVGFQADLAEAWYPTPAEQMAFVESVEDRIRALPGVEAVAVSDLPLILRGWNYSEVTELGGEAAAGFVETRRVLPGYFEALGVPLLAGRDIGREDREEAPIVVVINRELARQLFGDENPIGRRLDMGANEEGFEIVGVVGDIRESGPSRPPAPTMYWSLRQSPSSRLSVTVRSDRDLGRIEAGVNRAFRELAPNLPLFGVEPVYERVADTLGPRRLALSLLSIFAGLGLLLGAVGVYGLMAYNVERRTGEIALRQALGASPRKVLGQIVGEGGRLAIVGVVAGSLVGVVLRRALAGLLVGVESTDPAIYVAAATVLFSTALLACWIPARRAAQVQPMSALREE